MAGYRAPTAGAPFPELAVISRAARGLASRARIFHEALGHFGVAPGAYVLGGILTLLYALFFQLIPLSIRAIVAARRIPPRQ